MSTIDYTLRPGQRELLTAALEDSRYTSNDVREQYRDYLKRFPNDPSVSYSTWLDASGWIDHESESEATE